MKAEHLSDHEIQRYAFDSLECKTDVIEHMSSCSLCKKRVESYLALSNSIQDLPEPQLAFDLSNRVLTQLETTAGKRSILNYFIYSLIALGLVVIISCLFYSAGVLIDLFKSYSGISLTLVVSVALLISFGITADMLRSYNKKINMLNY
ncbi:hypothetical protein GCM10009122_61380 [Fulvivirga kasyanovii]|uniref:Zinc-finger domain-containing protein n=1 Tax=Fulvivirga kasyanovii TaxID=396812 RepID=A0ABW9RRZ0_9BACT|nr:hypothetical protein [Fulvivirga kasyanovii]MTI25820.1 hypothetical protein [Fulvivirga kasyanovii]